MRLRSVLGLSVLLPICALLLLTVPQGRNATSRVVSAAPATVEGNNESGWSVRPAISSDGRYVAFASLASNLVNGDTNNSVDVFVHDRETVDTTRVSVDSAVTKRATPARTLPLAATAVTLRSRRAPPTWCPAAMGIRMSWCTTVKRARPHA